MACQWSALSSVASQLVFSSGRHSYCNCQFSHQLDRISSKLIAGPVVPPSEACSGFVPLQYGHTVTNDLL